LARHDQKESEGYFDYVVGASLQQAQALIKSRQNKNFEAFYLAKGYPPSFVRSFKNRKLLLEQKDYPADWANYPINFPLTADAWQAELALIKKWNLALKEYAPELYAELRDSGK